METWRPHGDMEIFIEIWRKTIVFYLKSSKTVEMQFLRFSLYQKAHRKDFFMFVQLHLLLKKLLRYPL
jgi:hypothetical protein